MCTKRAHMYIVQFGFYCELHSIDLQTVTIFRLLAPKIFKSPCLSVYGGAQWLFERFGVCTLLYSVCTKAVQ